MTERSLWINYNPNPGSRHVGDCTVRAISAALDISWQTAYILLCAEGYFDYDMPSSDAVWGNILRCFGFIREVIPNTCPLCYTAEDFAYDHPNGVYVLGFGGHVATVVDGHLYDAWNSSHEIPIFFYYEED